MKPSFLSFLAEARSHPKQNPKISVNQAIEAYVNEHGESTYINMSNVEKLGINPSSRFDTPVGLYAYPTDYVLRLTSGGKSLTRLPYGGDAQYVNMFMYSGNVVRLDTLLEGDVEHYYDQIKRVWTALTGSRTHTPINKIIAHAQAKAKPLGIIGAQFWYVTWAVSDLIATKLKRNQAVLWSKLFKLLGINALLDKAGIIRAKEPVQIVFFTMDDITNEERVVNKWSDQSRELGIARGSRAVEVKQLVSSMSTNSIISLFKSGSLGGTDVNYVPADVRLAVLYVIPTLINHIDRPSDQELARAIASNPSVVADLDRRGLLNSTAVVNALELVSGNDAKLIVSDVSRTTALNPGSTFVASEELMHAMVDLDLHALRIVINKNKQPIPKSVIQHALTKVGNKIPTWLSTYVIKYNFQ